MKKILLILLLSSCYPVPDPQPEKPKEKHDPVIISQPPGDPSGDPDKG